jgi:hypothetical protein
MPSPRAVFETTKQDDGPDRSVVDLRADAGIREALVVLARGDTDPRHGPAVAVAQQAGRRVAGLVDEPMHPVARSAALANAQSFERTRQNMHQQVLGSPPSPKSAATSSQRSGVSGTISSGGSAMPAS